MRRTLHDRLSSLLARLAHWRNQAVLYRDEATTGMTADRVRNLRSDLVNTIETMDLVPASANTAAKATEELDYQGANIGNDFLAIRNALVSVGDRLALADTNMWNGFAIANSYPWAETVPTSADTVLATRLQTVIDAIDVFLGNIPQ